MHADRRTDDAREGNKQRSRQQPEQAAANKSERRGAGQRQAGHSDIDGSEDEGREAGMRADQLPRRQADPSPRRNQDGF